MYNDWNSTRTAQRWYRENIQSFSFDRSLTQKFIDDVQEQLNDKPDDQIARITINIPEFIASELYNAIGGKEGKGKPINFRLNGSMLPARIISMHKSDKLYKGIYTETSTYDLTIDTHPSIIPIEEYKNLVKTIFLLTSTGNLLVQI